MGFHAGQQWDLYWDALNGIQCDVLWDLANASKRPWCRVERGERFEFEGVWGWSLSSIVFEGKTIHLQGKRKTCTLKALFHAVLCLKHCLPYPAKSAKVPTWLDGAWFKGTQTFPRGILLVLVDDDDTDPYIQNSVVVSTHRGDTTIQS